MRTARASRPYLGRGSAGRLLARKSPGPTEVRKTHFCETNSPVKWRYMNTLERRGLESGKMDRRQHGWRRWTVKVVEKGERMTGNCGVLLSCNSLILEGYVI
jgi:hypothetical protein